MLQSDSESYKKKDEDAAGDYIQTGILNLENTQNFDIDPSQTSTHDDEKLWDYWREDPMLHVFHNLFHKVYEHTSPVERRQERFFYTHSHLTARVAVERRLVGLPDIGKQHYSSSSSHISSQSHYLQMLWMIQDLAMIFHIGDSSRYLDSIYYIV